MKKATIISVISAIAVLSIITGVFVFAGVFEDVSERVYISDFAFTNQDGEENILTANGTINATCKIKRTDVGTGAQPYVFILQIKDNGELIAANTAEGSIDVADGEMTISVSADLGNDTSKYEIQAFLWSDLKKMKPLANPAFFGSQNCELDEIRINGSKISGFSSDVYDYIYEFQRYPQNTPEITVFPKDYASKIEKTGEFPGLITYKVTSSDGSEVKEYKVRLSVLAVQNEKLVDEIKYKRRDNETAYTLYPYEDTTNLRSSIRNANGITLAATLNPSVWTIAAYLKFNLENLDIAFDKDILLKVRGTINSAMPIDLKLGAYEYDPTNSHKDWNNPGSSVDYAFKGEEIDSVTLLSDGEATVHADYRNFYFNVTDYIKGKIANGETEATIILMYRNEDLLRYQAQVIAGTFPSAYTKDFSVNMILNNKAVEIYNGTTSVYANGQPKLLYYTYNK